MPVVELESGIQNGQESGDHYSEKLNRLIAPYLRHFDQIAKRHVQYHLLFAAAGVVEISALLLFFTTLAESSVMALSLALLFLTTFAYFVMRLYLRMRLPEQLCQLRDSYVSACKRVIGFEEGRAQHHLVLAKAACRLAAPLREREYHYYHPPSWVEMLGPTLEKFSCWWHWPHVHAFNELLLQVSVAQHIEIVKKQPTNLEVHAALANAYVMLSSIYADPRKGEAFDEERWIPPQRYSSAMQDTFREISGRAIEEFKILHHYAPTDPWVHAQLAYSYHDLQMPEEEIREYETIIKLRPNDKETLFKLGMLYFQQGLNAEGLRVYEELVKSNFGRAEELIRFYGSYQPVNAAAEMSE